MKLKEVKSSLDIQQQSNSHILFFITILILKNGKKQCLEQLDLSVWNKVWDNIRRSIQTQLLNTWPNIINKPIRNSIRYSVESMQKENII
jgi:hypothetical protein